MLEQGTGVEPASAAWEAAVLPMYEPCVPLIIAPHKQKIKGSFLSVFAEGLYKMGLHRQGTGTIRPDGRGAVVGNGFTFIKQFARKPACCIDKGIENMVRFQYKTMWECTTNTEGEGI